MNLPTEVRPAKRGERRTAVLIPGDGPQAIDGTAWALHITTDGSKATDERVSLAILAMVGRLDGFEGIRVTLEVEK